MSLEENLWPSIRQKSGAMSFYRDNRGHLCRPHTKLRGYVREPIDAESQAWSSEIHFKISLKRRTRPNQLLQQISIIIPLAISA
jgi:hypothetical protein